MTELVLQDFPAALNVVCSALLVVAVGCAVFVAVDVVRRPPQMRVMAFVWPLTMLFGSVVWLVFYLRRGRATAPGHGRWAGTVIDTSHCGAGCALGDLIGEFGLAAFPALGVAVGLGALYQDRMIAGWIVDFVIAFVLGIVFQYFAIAPMRGLGVRAGLVAALKADALSIIAWQVGMYGLMAVWQLVVFPALVGGRASVFSPEFWVAMQLAMVAGFVCSYPVNVWLVRRGIKEAM
ncbi:DUF4396 domain-containing protein [Curtobacterium flaccumfaciens]|uniref:DUF4396 domain-containing protein n=1 Tax=Curtobacterium flaccumfaciens TaxID=2035 RepID=UPI002203D9FF|nr:DUF4396 domain-containing protein [Curtobacterium flaccumfaciens]MCS0471960.1 DUF4396 domain-containing protein [Curtobacterium flaccumfaciens pv. betae]MCS0476169.1 DUF4396 domain-containing protein [Curtobacterium flaccumfaciens pv. betae]MCS0478373.1 DUF4396 domain-containing protein [Curtobacterium flaccumfaciens pv. betae]MCS0483076.1 DUF4396 domain-containing protein [Curtobacterium flaccumfaciens pv. betae]MCS0485745.1 DUF4396 domain-containing protein [Curtobacterium flaccumfaciens 